MAVKRTTTAFGAAAPVNQEDVPTAAAVRHIQGTKAFGALGFQNEESPNSAAAAARAVRAMASVQRGGSPENIAMTSGDAAAAGVRGQGWKVPLLISYAYWDDRVVEDFKHWPGEYRLLMDSGAFTAHTKGKQIDFDEYCAFVKSPPVPLEGYFMLDVIGNPEATRRNLDRMLARGLKPIPIFTRGEDPKWLDQYYTVNTLVALGGVFAGGMGYVKWFEEHLRKGRAVHWLGVSSRPFVLHYRPTSFDSTTWVGGCRWGYISLFHLGRDDKVTRADVLRGKFQREITAMGFDYSALKREECWRRHQRESYIGKISAVSWLLYARQLEQRGTRAAAADPTGPHNDVAQMRTAAYGACEGGSSAIPNSTGAAAAAAEHAQKIAAYGAAKGYGADTPNSPTAAAAVRHIQQTDRQTDSVCGHRLSEPSQQRQRAAYRRSL